MIPYIYADTNNAFTLDAHFILNNIQLKMYSVHLHGTTNSKLIIIPSIYANANYTSSLDQLCV